MGELTGQARQKALDDAHRANMDQWDKLDQAIGGGLFTDDLKTASMRKVSRQYEVDYFTSSISWDDFIGKVQEEVHKQQSVQPGQPRDPAFLEEMEHLRIFNEIRDRDREYDRMDADRKNTQTINYSIQYAQEDRNKNRVKSWEDKSPLSKAFFTTAGLLFNLKIDKSTTAEKLDLVVKTANDLLPEILNDSIKSGASNNEANERLHAYSMALRMLGLNTVFTNYEILSHVEEQKTKRGQLNQEMTTLEV